MSSDSDYALGELDRRLGNVLRIGTIAAVDAANALATVDLGDLVTDWLPWLALRAGSNRTWSVPSVGEQVVIFTPGEPSQGVIIGGLFSGANPANGNDGKDTRVTFGDGSVVEFDSEASALNVQVNPAGNVRLNVGGTTLLLEDGQATLTTPHLIVDSPLSTFTGAVTIQGLLSWLAGMSGQGGPGAGGATITGNVTVSSGNVTADGVSLKTHGHIEQGDGARVSNPVT